MMDWEKSLQRLALIIPAVQITTCGLYIIGYSVGFRNQIGSLFSISDFFTITFNQLIMLYTSSIIVPSMMLLMRHRSGMTYAQDIIEATKDPFELRRELARLSFTRRCIIGILAFMFGMSSIVLIANILVAGFPIYQIFLIFLALSLTAIFHIEAKKHEIYGVRAELIWIGIVFLVAVFGFALDQGIRDRRLEYTKLGTSYYYCNKMKILSPIGENYIAVGPNQSRFIIDKDCKVIFSFPKTEPLFDGSLWDAVRSRLSS